jgi:hypothetical protein
MRCNYFKRERERERERERGGGLKIIFVVIHKTHVVAYKISPSSPQIKRQP